VSDEHPWPLSTSKFFASYYSRIGSYCGGNSSGLTVSQTIFHNPQLPNEKTRLNRSYHSESHSEVSYNPVGVAPPIISRGFIGIICGITGAWLGGWGAVDIDPKRRRLSALKVCGGMGLIILGLTFPILCLFTATWGWWL